MIFTYDDGRVNVFLADPGRLAAFRAELMINVKKILRELYPTAPCDLGVPEALPQVVATDLRIPHDYCVAIAHAPIRYH